MFQLSLFEEEAPELTLTEKIRAVIDEIKTLYLDKSTPGPWAVACSFGKDSTTVLSLVCRALQELPEDQRWREVHVLTSDTKMENPIMEEYTQRQSTFVNKWATQNGVPVKSHIVSRPPKRSFFYQTLGRGYPLPENGRDRYCTHALKIEPQNKFLQLLQPALLLLGTRTEESNRRARTIEKYQEEQGSRFGYSEYQKGIRFYTPIVELDTDEIWEYLQAPLPWGSSLEIRMLYREATGECGLLNPSGAKGRKHCNARMGCWICPVVQKDKSTENMALVYDYMLPLVSYRLAILEEWDGKKHPENRSGFMRNKKQLKPGQGCITIPTRRRMLNELLEAERQMNELRADAGLDPRKLISDEEVQMIRDQWAEDEAERPWLKGADEDAIDRTA